MGTFLTSKHGLGSRGPGGTPPSKPKSSTPPGNTTKHILVKMQNSPSNKDFVGFCLKFDSLSFESKEWVNFDNPRFS